MSDNLIAIIRKYKFERGPSFILACDAIGVGWLSARLSGFFQNDELHSREFVIGDDHPFSSDGKCQLLVVPDKEGAGSRIVPDQDVRYIWYLSKNDAEVAAKKIDVLARSNIPGHQYLESGRGPYQTVVVTKGEEPLNIIRRMRDDFSAKRPHWRIW